MADHDKPEKVTPDPALLAREIPQGAVAIGESANHESSAVTLGPIMLTTISILLVVVISDAALYVLYKFWQAREDAADRPETPLLAIRPEMHDPKLQIDEPTALVHAREEDTAPIEGYKWIEPGKFAAVPVEEAMQRIGASGKLPTGPEWTLRPDERMVGGVIMNPEQVKYASTPPSQALAGEPGAAPAPGQVGTAPSDRAAPAAAGAPTGTPAAAPRFGVTKQQAQPAGQQPPR